MTFPRKFGLLLILVAAAAAAGYEAGLALPSLRWFYSFDSEPGAFAADHWRSQQGRWVGHASSGLMVFTGLLLLVFGGSFQWNPLTLRRFARFRSIGRGWFAFRALVFLLLLATLDQAIVGRKALAVKYEGKWFFPAFRQAVYTGKDFGIEGDGEPDYRQLSETFKTAKTGNSVFMPPSKLSRTY